MRLESLVDRPELVTPTPTKQVTAERNLGQWAEGGGEPTRLVPVVVPVEQ